MSPTDDNRLASARSGGRGTPRRLRARGWQTPLTAALAFAWSHAAPATDGETACDAASLRDIKDRLPALAFRDRPAPDARTASCFRHYGLAPEGATHTYGFFPCGKRRLAAHVFTPPLSRATAILVHGYYDHAGVWRHLLPRLLEAHYTVALFELPGHGLSDGARASIGNFEEYRVSLRDFVGLCRQNLDAPFHLVAHSLGAGIAADCLLATNALPIDGEIVLLAPLLRQAHPHAAALAHTLAAPFWESVPRVFRKNSGDPEFRRFVREDPLHARVLPLDFCHALRAWGRDMAAHPASARRIHLLQGKRDTTVDWRYGLALLQEKFPQATITRLPRARHQLLNDAEPLRSEAIAFILSALDPDAP